MAWLDVLALAGITLVAVVLILEAGHFTARTIHARNAVKRQLELAREVQEALTRTSAIVARGPEAPVAEVVVEEMPQPDMAPVGLEVPVAELPGEGARTRRRRRRAAPESAEAVPRPYYFPLTEPQRRLLQELALGRRPASAGDRLGTEVMLEWLATLGFVRRGEGEVEYTITSLGRAVLGGGRQG